jgi:hypothetical protein
LPILPDLPTVAEAALLGYEAVPHYGIVSGELKARLADDGAEPLRSTPEEYVVDIDREETKRSAIVKASGAKGE